MKLELLCDGILDYKMTSVVLSLHCHKHLRRIALFFFKKKNVVAVVLDSKSEEIETE